MLALPDALPFAQAPDPDDELDFGLDVGALLAPAEAIDATTIVVTPTTDATARGLVVALVAPRQPRVAADARTIVFWLSIDPARRDDPGFDGFGVEVAVTIDFATTATPPRHYQRSAIVEMRNR